MSKFMLKYQDTEWDIDNPSLTITHEFVSGGIHAVLEHFENFLRSAGYAIDGKLEIVSVEDDSEEYDVNADVEVYQVPNDIKVDWPYGEYGDFKLEPYNISDLNSNITYKDNDITIIKIDSLDNSDNMNSSNTNKNDEITIKLQSKETINPNDDHIYFRV